jgi:hypothetical protein
VDRAIALLASEPALRGADVLLLQEMNGEATRRIAEALGPWYVYYPAFFHFRARTRRSPLRIGGPVPSST